MSKEWILNSATSRFQLNYKRNVGAVSEEIRTCMPQTIDDWRAYYFKNVRPEAHLIELGKKLYVKVTEVMTSEIESITEEDCIDYIFQLVIQRTFDGYKTEIETIYGQLAEQLAIDIQPAPDEWDRLFNVDFFIQSNKSYIGLQIKPVSHVSHIPQIHKERQLQASTHALFEKKYGGKVFYIISIKEGGKKRIFNTEVIEEIKKEVERLRNL